MNPTELRLQSRNDRLELVRQKHEGILADRDGGELSDTDQQQITMYREETTSLMTEIEGLLADKEAHDRSVERSKDIRRAMLDATDGVDGEDGVIYRTMAEYARDVILTGNGRESGKIAAQIGDPTLLQAAQARQELIKRVPTNTTSSTVAGLIPPQHISQIFQVIDKSRPLVESATRVGLERGTLTYPQVDTSPVVAVQSGEKTEGGTTGLAISMITRTATTYIGGGDLSWQAINWSTPNALDLWFQLVAADYALKTETDAGTILSASAFLNNIASPISGTPTFAQFMTAVGAGIAEVWANSGRIADTIYMAPDRYGYMLGLTSDAFSQFVDVSSAGIGPLKVVISRGFNAGEVAVGDRQALLCAETPGAPVELRVVEPSIGGVEVGLIGAFEAAVVDDGAFALITTAS